MKRILSILVLLPAAAALSFGQISVHGQGSAGYLKSEDGQSQYVVNGGNATFVWRWDLFTDVRVTDDISLFSNVRLLQDGVLHIDYFSLRVSDIASSGINAEAGLIDLPFGNLGERRFPKGNPFYSLPLMNEHLTSLCASDYRNWVLIPGVTISGDGVRLLDQGLYDTGLKLYTRLGIFDLSAALINGMVSETGTYTASGMNPNGGFGKIFRVGVTPFTGFTVGASYAAGPFMMDQASDTNSGQYDKDPRDYPQQIVMGDLEFSDGYFTMYGQAAYNVWKFGASSGEADEEEAWTTIHEDLNAFAYSLEGTYDVTTRVSLGARVGGMIFSEVADSVPSYSGTEYYQGKWDHDVMRIEGSVRYSVTRGLLLKCVYAWNRTFGLEEGPKDNLFVLQTVLSF